MAQSSGPQAFLFDRTQKRRIVEMMSKGSGTKAASAIGYDVGAMLSSSSTPSPTMRRWCKT